MKLVLSFFLLFLIAVDVGFFLININMPTHLNLIASYVSLGAGAFIAGMLVMLWVIGL